MSEPKVIFRTWIKRPWFSHVAILFEPRDMWIGLYWKRFPKALDLYICILPCIPINIYTHWN